MNLGEHICRRCGKCCYIKIRKNGKIYLTDKPCKNLNKDMTCSVYIKRTCLGHREALMKGLLPENCAYVEEWRKGYIYKSKLIERMAS